MGTDAETVLDRLRELREADPPTHGGRVLSYVYDPGQQTLEELARAAADLFLPVNGLDPTTYRSVAVLERELVGFVRACVHGGTDVVGSATTGGTESCILAVKSARDRHRAAHPDVPAVIVMPTTAHPAFRKAAAYLDVGLVEVPVTSTGTLAPAKFIDVLDEHAGQVALAVVSAPSYPTGALDPVGDIADACTDRGIDLHVDACLGGMVLPWWPAELPAWDFRCEAVTSMSVDLHKFGYAPKGVSVVLYRGRDRHRAQYFATTRWPGYPVVNPTLLGSRSASSLAAAWAVATYLGSGGYAQLVSQVAEATATLRAGIARIAGVKVLGEPTGPLIAVGADGPDGIDPYLLIDAVAEHGFLLQAQPRFLQSDGTVVPRSAHLTVTPVTLRVVDDLVAALEHAAEQVRGQPAPQGDPSLVAQVATQGLPATVSTLMATLETVPATAAPELLSRVLAAVIDPDAPGSEPWREV